MISVSGKNWEEYYTNKRIVEKIKIDHNLKLHGNLNRNQEKLLNLD
jgi:hypothetical protein